MAVSFATNPIYHYFNKDENNDDDINYARNSMDRWRAERASLHGEKPITFLDEALRVFKSCREKEVTVIFGNLGRHPLILNYFLDLGFSAHETVGVMTPWNIDCPYRIQQSIPALDVLFIIEPFFGYNIVKPSQVRHLVILTSHLAINMPNHSSQITQLFVGLPPVPVYHSMKFISKTVFEPLPYHDGSINHLPDKGSIHMDVTSSRSAQEAYLRLLTGREMLRNIPYTIEMLPRDEEIIKVNLQLTHKRIRELGWEKNVWIKSGYFDDFKNTGRVVVYERPI